MSEEIGELDLTAQASAAQTATNYITAVDSDGIKVHAANNVNSNYAAIDATGMEVVRGGTSVAKFGETTRIGEADANRIELDKDGLVQYTEDGVIGIRAGLSSTNHTLDVIHPEQNLRIGVAYWYKMYNRSESKHKSLSAEWPFLESTPTTGVSRFLLALRLDGFQDGAVVGNVTYAIAVPLARDYVFNVPGTTFYVGWNATNQALRVEKMTPDQQDSNGVYSTLRITYTGYGTVENAKSPVLMFGEHTSESAPGLYAVALGRESTSKGDNAFTSGIATTAASEAQTAIGKYNANSSANAFEVGNGTSDTARSNAFAVGWDGTVTHGGDVPWTNLPLTSSVVAFSDGQVPMYRKWGPVVTLCGAVKMASAQSEGFTVQIGQLPAGCRPKRSLNVLCQGSNREVWLLDINESGVVRASRYREGDTLVAVTTSTWFPFTATFLVA